MNTAITPIAIDAYVPIDTIDVNGRHRRDLGDIRALAASIEDVGLLNPVTLTREGRLVAGHRRMEAVRLLGMDSIPVRFADNLDDAAKLLRAERDENVCRLDMKPSELAALGEALLAIETDRAKDRQRNHGGTAPGRQRNTSGDASGSVAPGLTGDSRDAVGEALGMSGRTYSELRGAYTLANDSDAPAEHRQAAQEALDRMDAGEGIWPARQELRQTISNEVPQPEPEPEPGSAGPDWIPLPNEKGSRAAERRRELIAEMAPRGYSSGQMGDRLGILPQTIRKIARAEGITIVADKVIGRSRHSIDSNRIIREVVQDLENTEASLALISFSELDTSQIETWTTSLSKSIRMLSRLNKQLKEIVQ